MWGRTVHVKKNPLRFVSSLGRAVLHFAAVALADSPPQLSVIVMSAVVGFMLNRLPARPALTAMRME
jgi:hypothetical protein